MAFFSDEGDLHIDDNLFEFWGGLYDPHELDDAFAATAAAAAFLPISSGTSSATAAGVNPYSTNVNSSSVSRIPSPAVIVSTVNIPNGIFLASDASSYVNIAQTSPSPDIEATNDYSNGIPFVSNHTSKMSSSSSSSSSSISHSLPQTTAVSDDDVSSKDDDNQLVCTTLYVAIYHLSFILYCILFRFAFLYDFCVSFISDLNLSDLI